MPRGCKRRRIGCRPKVYFFKPGGIPLHFLEVITLREDEIEAIRLADEQNLYHEEAAKQMDVSRQTFGNILRSARTKIATALIHGKAIELECGGNYPSQNEFEQVTQTLCKIDGKEL